MDEQPTIRSLRRAVESLGDRLGVSPWSVLAAVAAIVGAVVGGWWALATPDPPPPEDVLPRASEVMALAPTTTTPVAEVLVVHVDGAVVVPGVHEVAAGARVIDAVEAAGGLSPDADRSRLNLAQLVGDGQRVWVPAVGEEEPGIIAPTGAAVEGAGVGPDGRASLDLNHASATALESLPGVGPSIAAAIVGHREREGPFRTVDDLLDVAGIGPARLAQLAPLVTV